MHYYNDNDNDNDNDKFYSGKQNIFTRHKIKKKKNMIHTI